MITLLCLLISFVCVCTSMNDDCKSYKKRHKCTIGEEKIENSNAIEHYIWGLNVREENDNPKIILDQFYFSSMKNCSILCLSGGNVKSIKPDTFTGLVNVTFIDLKSNLLSLLEVEIFKPLTSLKRLNLAQNKLHTIKSRTFVHLTSLEVLDLYGNDLRKLFKESFYGLACLTHLNLSENELGQLPNGTFSYLGSLKELLLFYNSILVISKDLFHGLTSLRFLHFGHMQQVRTIYINYTCIQMIENGSFNDLTNLTRLLLHDNALKILHTATFTGLKRLQWLTLANNDIETIEIGSFISLASLKELNLNKNMLRKLSMGMFNGLDNTEKLRLEYNGMQIIESGTFMGLSRLVELHLNRNKLTKLHNFIFKGLKKLYRLNLEDNHIYTIEKYAFTGLKNLKLLHLYHSGLCGIEEEAFSDLAKLQKLTLRYNKLTQLNNSLFLGLVNLKLLNLDDNKIHSIQNATFKNLGNLTKLYINSNKLTNLKKFLFLGLINLELLMMLHNNIKVIENHAFYGLQNLKSVYLTNNNIYKLGNRPFMDLIQLKELKMQFNKITRMQNGMFIGLDLLEELRLASNEIKVIMSGAFKGLTRLKSLFLNQNKIHFIEKESFADLCNLQNLQLYRNKITKLNSHVFVGLTNLEIIDLTNNEIHTVESTAFMLPAKKTVLIDLRGNKISDLSWTSFIKMPNIIRDDIKFSHSIYVDSPNFNCTRSICWMKHLNWHNIYTNSKRTFYISGRMKAPKNDLKDECGLKLEHICPSKDEWCPSDKNKCEDKCKGVGTKGGKLVVDGDVCPFQHFCKCVCFSCADKCALQGKIHENNSVYMYGCNVCNCQCQEKNCWKICNGNKFVLVNNTYGCLDCKCLCPEVDCDAKCNGTGLAITKTNTLGCIICAGCQEQTASRVKIWTPFVAPSAVSTFIFCLLFVLSIYAYKRNKKKTTLMVECKVTVLDILTQNLHPDVAQKVKENWVDPKDLSVAQLIGNGQFGIVWSGTYERAIGRKFSVAVKVAKAEYQDLWTVDRKWNSKHELRPHFEKRPVQVQLNNQVIEDLIMEGIIMTKLNHPNVLHVFGMSVYEEKPCLILPLMVNGDLKKFLKSKSSKLGNHNLTAFALQVAKGMAHLAERNCVHCDLAARNCMIDQNLVIKISDFGSATDLSDQEYYKLEDSTKPLPVRWISMEAIQTRKFTLENDVWSYGVVLWEIFTFGELPYKGIENTDVLQYLRNGHRLGNPERGSDNMYAIMLKCWNEDPNDRPNFSNILDMINKVADKEAEYIEVKEEILSSKEEEEVDETREEEMRQVK